MESIGTWWMWAGFLAIVLVMLAIDLFLVGGGKQHRVSFREAATWSVIWVGVSMTFAGLLWYGLETVRRYEALLEEACLEADVPFLPLLEGFLADPDWPQWLCSDGLHLNGEGHRRLYERVHRWPALLEWAELRPLSLATPLG